MSTGLALVTSERAHQIRQGYDADHDDAHEDGELAMQAAVLAANSTPLRLVDHDGEPDRWGLAHKHRHDRIKQLVVASALLIAEIERLKRLPEEPDNKTIDEMQSTITHLKLVNQAFTGTQLPSQFGKFIPKTLRANLEKALEDIQDNINEHIPF